MIQLRTTPKKQHIKVEPLGPDYKKDRERLEGISGKRPVYKAGMFDHWEMPPGRIENLIKLFKADEMDMDDGCRELVADFEYSTKPISELPRYTGEIFQPIDFDKDGKVFRDFQEDVVRLDFSKKNLLISFLAGLGKTSTTISRMMTIGYKKVLILGPTDVIDEWTKAFYEHCNMEILVYSGASNKKQREKLRELLPESPIVMANFEMAKELPIEGYDTIIIDEIHQLSSTKAAIRKAADAITKANPDAYHYGLSATPMRMQLDDLWSVLDLVDPKIAGSKSQFLKNFQKVIATITVRKMTKGGKVYEFEMPTKVETKNHKKLEKLLSCIMVRKGDREGVISFANEEEIVKVDMAPRQAEYYKITARKFREEIKDDPDNKQLLLERMLRLLQISEGPIEVSDGIVEESGKIDYVLEDLKNYPGRKAVILHRWLPNTRLLLKRLPGAVCYTGDVNKSLQKLAKWAFNGVTNDKDRAEFYKIKKRYPDFPYDIGEAQYLIMSYNHRKGVGVNLPAGSINYVMSFDDIPASLEQARDRIIRLSQTQDCITKYVVSRGTVEYKALKRILGKLKETHNVLDGKKSKMSLGTQELLDILNGDDE